jgi:hypothetical protein
MKRHSWTVVAVPVACAVVLAGSPGCEAFSASPTSASSSSGVGGASSGTGGSSSAGSAGAGATASGNGGEAGGQPLPCAPPAGNLFAHGTFEEGMKDKAPAFWEVRNPVMPATCLGSGTPAEHVFLTDGPPGCGGHALAIDARGQWDCYAVQRVSDYDSIEGGATYRVSALVRSTGNATNPAAWFVVGVQWVDASDGFFGDEKNPATASAAENDYGYKLLGWELVAPPQARRILVWLTAHYPGRVDFDAVSVVKL